MEKLSSNKSFDFSILFSAVTLWIIGVFLVYSATYIHTEGPLAGIYKSQILWVIMGIVIILAILSIPTRVYYSLSYIIYGISLFLLVYALYNGVVSKGAERWIPIGGIRLQPSEFAKLGLLFALAKHLSKKSVSLLNIRSFIMPGMLIVVPFLLVLKQPDLGTALVFCAMSLPMFFWAGMSLTEIFYTVSPGVSILLSAIPLILTYGSEKVWGIGSAIPWGIFLLSYALHFIFPGLPLFSFYVLLP